MSRSLNEILQPNDEPELFADRVINKDAINGSDNILVRSRQVEKIPDNFVAMQSTALGDQMTASNQYGNTYQQYAFASDGLDPRVFGDSDNYMFGGIGRYTLEEDVTKTQMKAHDQIDLMRQAHKAYDDDLNFLNMSSQKTQSKETNDLLKKLSGGAGTPPPGYGSPPPPNDGTPPGDGAIEEDGDDDEDGGLFSDFDKLVKKVDDLKNTVGVAGNIIRDVANIANGLDDLSPQGIYKTTQDILSLQRAISRDDKYEPLRDFTRNIFDDVRSTRTLNLRGVGNVPFRPSQMEREVKEREVKQQDDDEIRTDNQGLKTQEKKSINYLDYRGSQSYEDSIGQTLKNTRERLTDISKRLKERREKPSIIATPSKPSIIAIPVETDTVPVSTYQDSLELSKSAKKTLGIEEQKNEIYERGFSLGETFLRSRDIPRETQEYVPRQTRVQTLEQNLPTDISRMIVNEAKNMEAKEREARMKAKEAIPAKEVISKRATDIIDFITNQKEEIRNGYVYIPIGKGRLSHIEKTVIQLIQKNNTEMLQQYKNDIEEKIQSLKNSQKSYKSFSNALKYLNEYLK